MSDAEAPLSDCDSGPSGSGASTPVTPPKKRSRPWYQQAFRQEWLSDEEFKDWLQADSQDKHVAICTVCDAKLRNCNRFKLMTHKSSTKHVKNLNAKKKVTVIDDFFKKKTTGKDLQSEVSKAELLLSAFMAEHGTPFKQADHLIEVLKNMFPDSDIAQNMTFKKTKVSYLMRDGIALEEREEIAKICRENVFSLLIDESTDISVSQILAVMVRYFDHRKCKVTDALLDIVEVDDASGEGLFKAVKELLASKDIPLQNIIGFASDNCSAMLGINNGFQAFLKKEVPSVFILGCTCHSFALCASHACSQLPSFLEHFLRDVCCYFARSSKRLQQFHLLQDVVQSPKHRMLKLSQTRWLSRGQVISRIVEQWDALTLFFETEMKTDAVKIDGAGVIYRTMVNCGTKHMLVFLNYILGKVDKMNVEFQSECFRLGTLYATIADEYRSILAMFMKREVVLLKKLAEIDPCDKSLYKATEDINLGGRCQALLMKEPIVDQEAKKRFLLDCQKFLVELCKQIKKRFPLQEDCVLAKLQIIEPKEAMNPDRRVKSIAELAMHFPTLVKEKDLDDLEDQWQDLLSAKESLRGVNDKATSFWQEIRTVKDGNNHVKFNVLSDLMCGLLALPHSSACVERVFSTVNIIKTKQTNRLQVDAIADRLLAKQSISRQEVPCYKWKPSPLLISDAKTGKCHQRYIKRSNRSEQATLHSWEPDSGPDADDSPLQIFLQ